MGYQVVLSHSARNDLREIVRYLSIDSPERAIAFGRLLLSGTKRLADFPLMGRVVPEFGDSAIREIIVRAYRVVGVKAEPVAMTTATTTEHSKSSVFPAHGLAPLY